MPVYKYRTFEEAKRALWCKKPDRRYFRQLSGILAIADGLCPFRFPQGVFKYKSIGEANEQRKEWELAGARRTAQGRPLEFSADR
jgi:hypothetical protein